MRPTAHERFWSGVKKTEKCWLWTRSTAFAGYGQIMIAGKSQRVHRVSWELAHGVIPNGFCVCHTCDTPRCVRPSHLFLATQRGNLADMRHKGRASPMPRHAGTTHWKTHLTERDVRKIRSLYTKGHSLRVLERRYRIHFTAISSIVNHKTWKHIQ